MATAKEREQFIARFCNEFNRDEGGHPDSRKFTLQECMDAARKLLRHAATHGRLAVESCNGHPIQGMTPPKGTHMVAYNAMVNKRQDNWDARIAKQEAQVEKRMTEILAPFGIVPHFGGDPRGYTVKIQFPSRASNTMGGAEDGYGVPQ